MKGLTTCKICGRDFPLMAEEHYVARGVEKKGVIPALSGQDEATRYDAFDCPHCGCQNVMQERKQEIRPCDFGICDECDTVEDDEDKPDHDGCEKCKYAGVSEDEEPCNSCKGNYMDKFEEDEDE